MRRLLHAAVSATVACALYAVGATLFAAPAEARSARGTDGILYQPYENNRVVLEGTSEVGNVYTSNRGTDIDPDTPGIQVRGIMYFVTGCFAPRRPGTLAVTARIVSGDRGAVGIVVRNNGALPCVYAWAKTDADLDNDSVRVTATAVLTNNGTEVDRFEDTFTVEQWDTKSGLGVLSVERHDGTNELDEHTRANTLTFRVTFSEDVRNVNAADFGASGASGVGASNVEAVAGNDLQYIVTVSGGTLASHDGEVGLTFASGQGITDTLGNALDATLPVGTDYETYTLDNTRPTPTLGASPQVHNGTSTTVLTIDFGEPVTGFKANDIVATNATKRNFTGSDGAARYTVALTPTAERNIVARIAGSRARDRVGNPSYASASLTVTYEDTLVLEDEDDLVFTVGVPIEPVVLKAATGGTPPVLYTPIRVGTQSLAGLEYDPDTRTLSGTPRTATPGAVVMTYWAEDSSKPDRILVYITFTITINPAPTLAAVSDQTFTVDTDIGTVELPKAAGGTLPLTYRLTGPSESALPSWMTFDGTADPPSIIGTPDAVAPAVTLTYTATDANGARAEVEFDVTVVEAASAGTEAPESGLAARFGALPDWHAGMAFWTELHFSEAPNLGYLDVRDKLFEVTGGRLLRAQRLEQNSNRSWRIEVLPAGFDDITLTLPATEDCAAPRAVCTQDGRKLARGLSVTIEGPAAFSVSDAEANEDAGAALVFEVSLSRPLRAEARVDVATRDGTATAGADYEAVTQTLVFAPGETVKTVEVPVLDDAHDEGEETMTLVLSNAEGAPVADAEGTGTIVNNDAIPKAWTARFGRTVTGQVLDAVEARLAAPRQAGGRMTVAGYALVAPDGSGASAGTGMSTQTPVQATAEDRAAMAALGDWMDGARTGRSQGRHERWDGGPEPKSLEITRHGLVTGTAFTLSAGSADGGGFASLWGRGTVTRFDGREEALSLDGEVTTGFLGADWAADPGSGSGAGRRTAGLALGHSVGTGGYRNGTCEENAPADAAQSGGCGGRIEAELTGLYPYAGLDVTKRVSVWLAGGHGAGELTVVPDGSGAIETDLAMGMGAAGTRIAVLEPEGGEGLSLALKGDGRFTRTSSDAARGPDGGNLADAEADAWLLRFGVEGSRRFALAGPGVAGPGVARSGVARPGAGDTGASLTPSFEVGVRRDGGDAETGFGADMGGGVAFADAGRGLRLDLKGRALVAHDAPGFREWGASAAFGFDPRPSTERGLALSLTQSWGASPSGGMDALLGRETLAGFAVNDAGTGFEASSRLTGELGYGLPAFGGAFTGTPNVGFGLSSGGVRDWRLGWRLTSARRGGPGFEVNLDATRHEGAGEPAEHGAKLTGTFRW